MTQTPYEFRNHNPFGDPKTAHAFTSLHLFCFQRMLFHTTRYSRPISKADFLNELPQHFGTSPFQKPEDCISKSYSKE